MPPQRVDHDSSFLGYAHVTVQGRPHQTAEIWSNRIWLKRPEGPDLDPSVDLEVLHCEGPNGPFAVEGRVYTVHAPDVMIIVETEIDRALLFESPPA